MNDSGKHEAGVGFPIGNPTPQLTEVFSVNWGRDEPSGQIKKTPRWLNLNTLQTKNLIQAALHVDRELESRVKAKARHRLLPKFLPCGRR